MGFGFGGKRTLFTFPNRRVYSSRTSCSRELTRGFVVRRRGLGVSVAEEGEGSSVWMAEWSWSWGGEDILMGVLLVHFLF